MSLKEVYQLSLAAGFLQVKLREDHELILLAERIDWESLTRKLRSKYSKVGRRAKHMRMMIGLHFLKHLYNLSDETVCNMLHENVYHRFFCGLYGDIEDWERKRPLNPSTMSHFRKRLGADGMKVIEDVIKEQLKKERRVSKRTQVVDTTAMEKHIAYPTDTNLLVKGMQRVRRIVDKLKKLGVEMSVRSYKRLARQQVLLINKLGRGRKDRLEQATKNLMKYAKSMCNKVSSGIAAASEQGLEAVAMFKEAVEKEIEKLHKVIDQAKRRLAGEQVPAKDKIFRGCLYRS